jgi:hypothetical protein
MIRDAQKREKHKRRRKKDLHSHSRTLLSGIQNIENLRPECPPTISGYGKITQKGKLLQKRT